MRFTDTVFNTMFKCCIPLAMSFSLYAVQPMTESDLEIVSATTGDNILDIFGASEAGLRVDDTKVEPGSATLESGSSVQLDKEQFQEGESAKNVAAIELREIEQKRQAGKIIEPQAGISRDIQNATLLSNESTRKSSAAYSTSSEINYKTANFKHQMRELDNGGIAVERDLQIDLLKLENLKGAHYEERSVGSIFMSDWRSQGDTRIVTEQR